MRGVAGVLPSRSPPAGNASTETTAHICVSVPAHGEGLRLGLSCSVSNCAYKLAHEKNKSIAYLFQIASGTGLGAFLSRLAQPERGLK